MAVGLTVTVRGLNEDLDDVAYLGVIGMSLNADMSTLTLTGTAGANNFGNSAVVAVSAARQVIIAHAGAHQSWGTTPSDRPPGT